MSHILHFYHLVALDYVKPVVDAAGTPLTRPFLAPRYDDAYYINHARVWAVAPIIPGPTVAILCQLFNGNVLPTGGDLANINAPIWANLANGINYYLTGQYLRALNFRRMCHEIQAIFSGRAPHNSGWTPGGATSAVKQSDIDKANKILYKGTGSGTPSNPASGTIMDFVGDPLDFANGKVGTMMFDVVAAAHLFYEYFWIGNSCGNYMAYGWGEEAGQIHYSDSVYGGILFAGNGGNKTNSDQRASARGYVVGSEGSPSYGGCISPIIHLGLNILNIGESVQTSSMYVPYAGFRHPWKGLTNPDPDKIANPGGYSWVKAPRYDTVANPSTLADPHNQADYKVFEVGPLSRMVVNGCYFAGVLNVAGYTATPTAGAAGPNTSTGSGHPLESVYALIPGVTGGPNLSAVNYNGDSVLDRIATRALETRMMCDQLVLWLNLVQGTLSAGSGWSTTGITDDTVPIKKTVVKKGYGMTEASRGALSHWVKYKNGKITNYQAVVPTTWNASPRDANGNPGPAEQSLMSGGGAWVANPAQAIELPRITHSYDFCLACAIHVITPEGEVIKIDVPTLPG
jgi:Ni,Fe-hydrogenase I large subunit